MQRVLPIIFVILLTVFDSHAREIQRCDIPINFEGLWNKAAEVYYNILDHDTLLFFIDISSKTKKGNMPTEEDIKDLNNICVILFTFDEESHYTEEDQVKLLNQMQPPIWRQVTANGEQDDGAVKMFLHMEEEYPIGLAMVSKEESSLHFIYINGAIDTEDLEELNGKFGIPVFHKGAALEKNEEEKIK